MDREWMSASRLSQEYEDGVKMFIRFAVEHEEDPTKIVCPCLKCCFAKRISAADLEDHLIMYGIDQSYKCRTRHGETRCKGSDPGNIENHAAADANANIYEDDQMEEFAKVVEEDLRDCPEMFERLVSDSEKPLYDGCTKYTRLSTVLKLYNLKASNGWSDKSFTELLALLKDMLPENNVYSRLFSTSN
ncbi:uncharacterized protein LOC130735722 [Lotus japonicus]|uniref:uncharacterized protein LOC130735722 n=1 Tax=Lotus japonicus TaxID=34305 RepID=UPI0025869EB3|nr:uncharacterized protein LOC130735722 [Lotus japonicus]XP_057443611.1 uncharacterized protein LOC130735722 [Lotus japonicus]